MISIISVGNPTVIAATPSRLLTDTTANRPSLIAFISGSPTPNSNDITWYFNNGSVPPGVEFLGGNTQLFLPLSTPPEFSGIYTVQVTTSSGTASDNFNVTVPRELMYTYFFYILDVVDSHIYL